MFWIIDARFFVRAKVMEEDEKGDLNSRRYMLCIYTKLSGKHVDRLSYLRYARVFAWGTN